MRIILALAAMATAACGTVPPKKVTTGLGVPRGTVLDLASPSSETFPLMSLGGNFQRTPGVTDSGDRVLGNALGGWFEFQPAQPFGLGIHLFFVDVDPDLDASNTTGAELYLRWRALKFSKFHLYLVPSFRFAENRASDEGKSCYFFSCTDNGDKASASLKLSEPGIGLIFEYFFVDEHSLAFVPTFYRTRFKTRNILSGVTQHEFKELQWNYSGLLYYSFRQPDFALRIGGGATTHQSYGNAGDKRKYSGVAHLAIQFGFAHRGHPKEEVE